MSATPTTRSWRSTISSTPSASWRCWASVWNGLGSRSTPTSLGECGAFVRMRLVDFRPRVTEGTRHPDTDGTSFDFLGLTHLWGRSRKGKDMVRQITAKNRFARALAAVSDWCRNHRHWKLRDQHRHLSSMLRGHFAYYGVGGNSRRLRGYAHQAVRIWRKWLSRRDRATVVPWARLREILKRHPLPSQDRPWIHRRQRISLVKNRMRETRTSGSVGDGDGNVPIYPAKACSRRGLVFGRAQSSHRIAPAQQRRPSLHPAQRLDVEVADLLA